MTARLLAGVEAARNAAGLALLAFTAALIGTGAVTFPLLVIAAPIGIAYAVLAFRNLAAGVALLTALTFFTRIPALSSSGFTFVKLAGVVLALSWGLVIAHRRGRVPLLLRDHPAVGWSALGFWGWAVLSGLWAPDSGLWGASVFRLGQNFLLLFISFTAFTRPRHLHWFLGAFIAGATVSAAVGLGGATSPKEFNPNAVEQRLSGGIGDPNELAAVLVPAIAFALFALAVTRTPLVRSLLIAAVGISGFALFRTESRGGLVALAVTAIATIVLAGPVRIRAVSGILATAGAGIVYYTMVAPPEVLHRVLGYEESGGSGRTDLWRVAIAVFQHHPFAGIGSGNFAAVEPGYSLSDVSIRRLDFVVDRGQPVHNTYLHLLTEVGLIGFIPFVAMVVGAFLLALRAVGQFERDGDLELEILARGLIIGAIGMLAAFFFISAQTEKQLPLLIGTLAALFSMTGRNRAIDR